MRTLLAAFVAAVGIYLVATSLSSAAGGVAFAGFSSSVLLASLGVLLLGCSGWMLFAR